MFKNLRAEMARTGVSGIEIAEYIGVSKATFYFKMSGSHDWKLAEMLKVQRFFSEMGKDYTIDYLFS